jgi:hypothetical protein
MSVKATVIKKDLCRLVWHVVEPMIQAAIEHSNEELTTKSIYDKVIVGDMLLVNITEGDKILSAITLEKRDFPSGKSVLTICTAGGSDLYKWQHLIDKVSTDIAKENGCEEVYIIGRPGWQKMLISNGYELVHTVLSKKV